MKHWLNPPSNLKMASVCTPHAYVHTKSHKVAKSMANLDNHVLIYSWVSACPREMELLWTSAKPQKQATAKAAWATFSTNICLILVNVCSYHVMVKCVCCSCEHGSQLFRKSSDICRFCKFTYKIFNIKRIDMQAIAILFIMDSCNTPKQWLESLFTLWYCSFHSKWNYRQSCKYLSM